MFSAPFRSSAGSDTVTVFINVDGTNKRTCKYKISGDNGVVSFQHLETGLTAGSHTVKIRWAGASSMSQYGSTDSERILTVIDMS
jgi:hypothetical protein